MDVGDFCRRRSEKSPATADAVRPPEAAMRFRRARPCPTRRCRHTSSAGTASTCNACSGCPICRRPCPSPPRTPASRVSLRSGAPASRPQRGAARHPHPSAAGHHGPPQPVAARPDARRRRVPCSPGWSAAPRSARLSGLRDVRREQRFAFPIGETLITGVFDVIAQDRPDHLLVLDYKSDRLAGADPWEIVAERYLAQRTIYALAALKLGAPRWRSCTCSSRRPRIRCRPSSRSPRSRSWRRDLAERVAGPLTGDFRVTALRAAGSATAARPRAGSAPTRSS